MRPGDNYREVTNTMMAREKTLEKCWERVRKSSGTLFFYC
jgi:hypothetical protein